VSACRDHTVFLCNLAYS